MQYDKWQQARRGLAQGHVPRLAQDGCGGSYFIPDEQGQNVAVFKPSDEEPHAANNPRERCGGSCSKPSADGYGLRKGVCPGEGAIREVQSTLPDTPVWEAASTGHCMCVRTLLEFSILQVPCLAINLRGVLRQAIGWSRLSRTLHTVKAAVWLQGCE